MCASVNSSYETFEHVGRNNSSNADPLSEYCDDIEISMAPREVKIVIHVITLVVALVGNSLLIAAYKRMREPFVLLIANMAASDLLTAIFLLPRLITIGIVESIGWQVQGPGGKILCKISTFLSDISLSVSTQSMVIIAVERFLCVIHPVKARSITAKMRRFLILLTWIVAMALHSPYLYVMELVKDYKHNITICQNKWETTNKPAFLWYNIFLYVTVLFLPLVVISILYPFTVVYMRRDKITAQRTSKGIKRSRKRNANLFKLATVTVLSLIICWSPYSVIIFLGFFAPNALPKCSLFFLVIEYISRVLASSYCAVNPFICFLFLRNFRSELGIICKRRKPVALLQKKNDSKISGGILTTVHRHGNTQQA